MIERQPLPSVTADRMQMVQLFQNLLSNAIKFAGRGRRASTSRRAGRGGMHGRGFATRGSGSIRSIAERIFKIFRRLRRDTPGTGIGLAVCKKIVERHGGRIEAASEPGEGRDVHRSLCRCTPAQEGAS